MLSDATRDNMIKAGFNPDCEKYSSEYQRYVRSHVSSQSCKRNGAKGFAALVKSGKGDLAHEKAADWRFAHPSDLERIVVVALTELGLPTDRQYREVKIGRYYVDFRYGDYVIEVNDDTWHTNDFHGDDRVGRDKRKYAYLSEQGYTIIILPEQAIRSGQVLETLIGLNLLKQEF